jgi:hypothetical protein
MFNSEILIWTKLNIGVYGEIKAMFVDTNHFLTLSATNNTSKSTIYRFALR